MPYGQNIRFTLTYNVLSEQSDDYGTGMRWANSFSPFISFNAEEGSYQHYGRDGRVDVYAQPEGSTGYEIDARYLMGGEAAYGPAFSLGSDAITLSFPGGYQETYQKLSDIRYVLSESTDADGNTVRYHYTAGKLVSVEAANGALFTVTHNGAGLISEVTDPTGRKAVLEYDSNLNLVAITDMQGYRAILGYDSNAYITSITDAMGTTAFRLEQGDETDTGSTSYPAPGEPMGLSNRLTVTDPLGHKSEYYYNSASGQAWYVAPEHYRTYISSNDNNAQSGVPKKVFTYKRYEEGYSRIEKVTFQDGTWVSFSTMRTVT